MKLYLKLISVVVALGTVSFSAYADTIRFLCYQDGNECEVMEAMAKDFKISTGHSVVIDTVPYEVIRNQLGNQLQASTLPDVARITNLGGMREYYLDLTPYVDIKHWNTNYSITLPLFRASKSDDQGIYGWISGMTVTGPYINVTMFDDAGIAVPGPDSSWDDWMDVLKDLKETIGMEYVFAMDLSGQRWAGPAFSYGAEFFDDEGMPILVDSGFRTYAEKFVQWHKEKLMPIDIWGTGEGKKYKSAASFFVAQKVAMYMSGSWMVNSFKSNIKDFEWKVVPAPCGTHGCGAVPGGAAVVAFKYTKSPEAAAQWIDFLSQEEQSKHFAIATSTLTAHQGLQHSGIDYYSNSGPAVSQALITFKTTAKRAFETSSQAYTLAAYSKNYVIYNSISEYMAKAINGKISLHDSLNALDNNVAAKITE